MIMPPPLGQFMTLEEFTDFYNHAEEWVDKFVSHKFDRNAFYFEEEPEVWKKCSSKPYLKSA